MEDLKAQSMIWKQVKLVHICAAQSKLYLDPESKFDDEKIITISLHNLMIPGLSSGSLDTNSGPSMIKTAKTPTEVNTDYFHLLVGICMESLCSSRATQPNSTVSACLNAFYSLLDSRWARTLIGNEQVL